MVKPDDDFDDDFEDGVPMEVVSTEAIEAMAKPDRKQHNTRRKIEEFLERRRLEKELDDLGH